MLAERSRLVFVRHGQASLGSGDYDRLSELGREQSRLLGRRLAEQFGDDWALWSGTLKRHRQTLAAFGPDRAGVFDSNLNEYSVGDLIARAMTQATELGLTPPGPEAFADPVAYLQRFLQWFPEVLEMWQSGELEDPVNGSWTDFSRRVSSVVPAWQTALASGRSVVVVSSAGVISTVLTGLLDKPLEWQRQINVRMANTALSELQVDSQGRWHLTRLNCLDHLDDEQLQTLA